MSKALSVKSSSVSSDERSNAGLFGNLISWKIFYKLSNKLPYQHLWIVLKAYNMLALMSLCIDPDFAWGPITKKVLKIIYFPLRGYYFSQGGSYTNMIILESVLFGFMLVTFFTLYLVLRDEHSKGRTLMLLQILLMMIAQVFPVPLSSMVLEPWKCNLATGMMVKFPDQYCFEVPNVIFFVLSIISIAILGFETFVRYYL
jgi:hypothetical protein